MSELGSCETCTWWRKWYDGDKGQAALGVCLRHPPTAQSPISKYQPDNKAKYHTIYFNEGIWPSTMPEDYCGEHNQIDDYDEDSFEDEESMNTLEDDPPPRPLPSEPFKKA